MELTDSWVREVPAPIRARYDFIETRDAAAVLHSTSPEQFADLCAVLDGFALTTQAVLAAGGNETMIAGRLNAGFRERGWREARAVTRVDTYMQERGPARGSGDGAIRARATESNVGYYIDNVKGKVVLDVEWNAKDGNLDRDLGMYRWLYDIGFVAVAVIITREHHELREFGRQLRSRAGQPEDAVRAWLSTTTSTNMAKLAERLRAGNAGGAPVLAVAVTRRTWDGAPPPDTARSAEPWPEAEPLWPAED